MANEMILNEKVFLGYDLIANISKIITKNNYNKVLFIKNELKEYNIVNELKNKNIDIINYNVDEKNNIYFNITNIQNLIKEEKIKCVICCGKNDIINIGKIIGKLNEANEIILIPENNFWYSSRMTDFYCYDEKNMNYVFESNALLENTTTIIDYNIIKQMSKKSILENCVDSLYVGIENYNNNECGIINDILNINSCSLIYKNIESIINKSKFSVEELACAMFMCGAGNKIEKNLCMMMKLAMKIYAKDLYEQAYRIIFPYYLKSKLKSNSSMILNLANSLNIKCESNEQIRNEIINKMSLINEEIGIPKKLSEINFPKELIPTIAKQTVKNLCNYKNEKNIDEKEIIEILKSAY